MDSEMRELVGAVCRAACRVESLDPNEPMREWESEACAYRPSDPVWTRYATEEMIAAIERIYAAGFEDAKGMAADAVEDAMDMIPTQGGHAAMAAAVTAIRSLHPQEPSDAQP